MCIRDSDDAVQLRAQQAEKEAEKERKYKKHSVLDNTALFLFIVLIAYGQEQEKYFAKGSYDEDEERVAGSPEYAFNADDIADGKA